MTNIYFIPDFKVNLLFVSCLFQTSQLSLVFLPNKYLLQDMNTKQVVGEASQQGNLYQLISPLVTLHLSTLPPHI